MYLFTAKIVYNFGNRSAIGLGFATLLDDLIEIEVSAFSFQVLLSEQTCNYQW